MVDVLREFFRDFAAGEFLDAVSELLQVFICGWDEGFGVFGGGMSAEVEG